MVKPFKNAANRMGHFLLAPIADAGPDGKPKLFKYLNAIEPASECKPEIARPIPSNIDFFDAVIVSIGISFIVVPTINFEISSVTLKLEFKLLVGVNDSIF